MKPARTDLPSDSPFLLTSRWKSGSWPMTLAGVDLGVGVGLAATVVPGWTDAEVGGK
jgi:hypothetical protein